jgi:hypothetical protein
MSYTKGMTTTSARRRFAHIKREVRADRSAFFVIQVKDADDFRRYPYGIGGRYATRVEAAEEAERQGAILVQRWCDAELTAAEAKASGY